MVGADEDFDLLGLDGQETYYVAIAANDTGSDGVKGADAGADDRQVLSLEVVVTTKSVDLQLRPPMGGEPLTLVKGQSAMTALAVTGAVTKFPVRSFSTTTVKTLNRQNSNRRRKQQHGCDQ